MWRERGADGRFARDVVSLETKSAGGEPLVGRVMAGGRRLRIATLAEARSRAAREIDALPVRLAVLEDSAQPYTLTVSPGLEALARQVDAARADGEGVDPYQARGRQAGDNEVEGMRRRAR